jgi:hypothetical protein
MEFSADTKSLADALEQTQGARVARTAAFAVCGSCPMTAFRGIARTMQDLKTKFSSRTDGQAAALKNRGPRYPPSHALIEGHQVRTARTCSVDAVAEAATLLELLVAAFYYLARRRLGNRSRCKH